MSQVYCEQVGSGPDLVLVHGWGLSGAVWQGLVPLLAPHFRLHLVDLPGFGHSRQHGALSLDQQARACAAVVPAGAIWLGWSLGGLVAVTAALAGHGQLRGVVWVATSPCFVSKEGWPGTDGALLERFRHELAANYRATLERFVAIQVMGSRTARAELKWLREQLNARPEPAPEALDNGLALLANSDLRQAIQSLKQPLLRYYGEHDSLVPQASRHLGPWPAGGQRLFAGAAHAPFISDPEAFAAALMVDLAPLCAMAQSGK